MFTKRATAFIIGIEWFAAQRKSKILIDLSEIEASPPAEGPGVLKTAGCQCRLESGIWGIAG